MAGGADEAAVVDEAQHTIHAQPQAFQHGGEVPGVGPLAVHVGLAAHGVEPGAVQEGPSPVRWPIDGARATLRQRSCFGYRAGVTSR